MICWLSNGEGPLGGGGRPGVSITNRLLLGGRLRNKKFCRGGGRQRNDGFTKKIPPPHLQLINNDRLLMTITDKKITKATANLVHDCQIT